MPHTENARCAGTLPIAANDNEPSWPQNPRKPSTPKLAAFWFDWMPKRRRSQGTVVEWTRKGGRADPAVFDVARELPALVDEKGDWTPSKTKALPGVPVFRCGSDGPSTECRIKAQAVWTTSNRYSGQHVNDNKDWPLAKLLRAENNHHCLALAERYRAVFDAANEPCGLLGKDVADNVYIMTDLRLDASTGKMVDKGAKKVTGRKARLDDPAARSVNADPDKTKKRAKPVPKRWNGDWPLLHKIDTSRELADAQAALGWLRQAFEAAVCGGETLEAIGREHGVGNQAGAKGAGRALVYLGLQCIDEFWGKPARRAA